jgi:CheY-like chemotaxis protein
LRFEITDTGVGIPADKQSKLFQLFTQADSTTTRHYGGTGLGLAISKRLVELMGGEIGLRSEPDKGSVFWFTLPARGWLSGALSAPSTTVFATRHREEDTQMFKRRPVRLRVLLAEDDATNRELAVHLLEKLYCQVDVASNGLEAVVLAGQVHYDLIFMDCEMPEMDGLAATQEIRATENRSVRTPIVAITANVFGGHREKCLAVGMDDFIEKPIYGQELVRVLQKWAGNVDEKRPNETPSPPSHYENVGCR